MNCINCLKKHLALLSLHLKLYNKTKNKNHYIRINGQFMNIIQHAKHINNNTLQIILTIKTDIEKICQAENINNIINKIQQLYYQQGK